MDSLMTKLHNELYATCVSWPIIYPKAAFHILLYEMDFLLNFLVIFTLLFMELK